MANPLTGSFEFEGSKRYVIAVVEDFNYSDFYYKVQPAMLMIAPREKYTYLIVKAEPGYANTVLSDMEKTWKNISGDDPFRGFIQHDAFKTFVDNVHANNKVVFFVSGFAVLLATMGLYGLVAYNLTRRLREFSIRKVFGARTQDIFKLMNRDYLWVVAIAFILGAPLGAFLMNSFLKASYVDEIPPVSWPYVISISIMVLTVFLTLWSQLMRVTRENPVNTLRID